MRDDPRGAVHDTPIAVAVAVAIGAATGCKGRSIEDIKFDRAESLPGFDIVRFTDPVSPIGRTGEILLRRSR